MIDRRSFVEALAILPIAAQAGAAEPLRIDESTLLNELTAPMGSPHNLPWIPTPHDGLGLIFDQARLTRGKIGRDFGCPIPESILSLPPATLVVDGAAPRLLIGNRGPHHLCGLRVINHYISIDPAADDVSIEDCVIRASAWDVGSGSPNAIATAPSGGRLDLVACSVSGGYQAIIGLQRPGSVQRCYLADSRGDGFNLRGTAGRKILEGNLVHRLGQNAPLAHSDCLQFNPGDDSENFWIMRNTFYMPGDGPFSEATNGATSVINASTQGGSDPVGGRATRIARVVLAGNLLAGGVYTVSWTPRAGGVVENVVSCNNLYAPSAYRPFHLGDDLLFYPGPRDHTQRGRISNLIFHNEKMTDGRPVFHRGRPLDGIWHHDRERLLSDPLTLRLAQKFGLVDADGELLPGIESKGPFLID